MAKAPGGTRAAVGGGHGGMREETQTRNRDNFVKTVAVGVGMQEEMWTCDRDNFVKAVGRS